MITTKEAYIKTQNQQQINKILKGLEKYIEECIEKGYYSIEYSISLDTSDYVRNYIIKYLKDLGYDVEITNNEELNNKMGSHSIDQGYYYDSIKVNWKEAKGK